MKKIVFLFLVVMSLSVAVWVAAYATDESNTPGDVVINFEAQQVSESVWEGPATGGAAGTATVEALNVPPALFKGTWAGVSRWQVVAGSGSFAAEMTGKINTYNGVLAMRGKVVGGSNAGAPVTANAQIASVNPHRFVGTIRVITP